MVPKRIVAVSVLLLVALPSFAKIIPIISAGNNTTLAINRVNNHTSSSAIHRDLSGYETHRKQNATQLRQGITFAPPTAAKILQIIFPSPSPFAQPTFTPVAKPPLPTIFPSASPVTPPTLAVATTAPPPTIFPSASPMIQPTLSPPTSTLPKPPTSSMMTPPVAFSPRLPDLEAEKKCGPQKQAVQNTENKEEVCTLQLTRLTREVQLARMQRTAAERRFGVAENNLMEVSQDVRRILSGIRATRAALLSRPNSAALRRRLRNLRRGLRLALRRRNAAVKFRNVTRAVYEDALRREDVAVGQVESVENTLESVRETLVSLRALYLQCLQET